MLRPAYQPRQPRQTALWQTLQREWNGFRHSSGEDGRQIPAFVDSGVRRFLACGSLASGFARLRCTSCRDELLVAFSCKVRGLCPSCDGRRMAQQAAHLVDEVIPAVPTRQWVLSLPFWLRYRVAYDHKLLTEILAVWVRTVTCFYRKRARTQHGISDGHCAAFSAIQRFGDGIRLNPHVHTLFADGVWHAVAGSDAPNFQRIRSPTQREVEDLTLAVRRRVLRRLARLGVLRHDLEDPSADLFLEREPVLADAMTASLLDRVAVGERKGELVMRLRDEVVQAHGHGTRCAMADGFNVHAATTIAPLDRVRLERLCKYMLRPAICNERLQRLESGEILLTLKRRWSDGTFAKLFQPQDFISKVLALLPAPGTNLVRFHGQFAPGARWRAFVARGAPAKAKRIASAGEDSEQRRQRTMAWATLLRRSFAFDVLVCPRCGGRRELLALIEHKPTVQKILEHLGLESEVPAFAAPRGPPLFTGYTGSVDGDRDRGERRVDIDPDFAEPDAG